MSTEAKQKTADDFRFKWYERGLGKVEGWLWFIFWSQTPIIAAIRSQRVGVGSAVGDAIVAAVFFVCVGQFVRQVDIWTGEITRLQFLKMAFAFAEFGKDRKVPDDERREWQADYYNTHHQNHTQSRFMCGVMSLAVIAVRLSALAIAMGFGAMVWEAA